MLWLQFSYENKTRLGVLDGDIIHIYSGDIFHDPQPVGEGCRLADVEILIGRIYLCGYGRSRRHCDPPACQAAIHLAAGYHRRRKKQAGAKDVRQGRTPGGQIETGRIWSP